MKRIFAVLAVAAAFAPAMALAQSPTSSGTLTVTATIEPSIGLTIEAAGGTFATQAGMGTDTASTDLGLISKFGAAPENFTVSRGNDDWTLTSAITIGVEQANGGSANYTLEASLSAPPDVGVEWQIDGTVLSIAPAVVTATGAYGGTAYPWVLVIDDAANAAPIDNVIQFTATSN